MYSEPPPLTQDRPDFVPGPNEQLIPLTYSPLPWNTHPIDISNGPNGWGPFHGPWTPQDFWSPYWGIDATWLHGDNAIFFSPGYGNLTVYEDSSIDFVANTSALVELQRQVESMSQSFANTMANGSSQDSAPSSPQTSVKVRLMKSLGMGEYANG
jgi:hypothetical protein